MFLKITLLILGVIFSYQAQAQAQICTATVDNDANCGNNGCVSATTTGGNGPYTYVWHDLNNSFPPIASISTNNQRCNLPEGDFYCVITDANNDVCTTNTVTVANTAASLQSLHLVRFLVTGYVMENLVYLLYPLVEIIYTWSDDPSLSNILGTGTTLSMHVQVHIISS